MAKAVASMVRESIESFANEDLKKTKEVIKEFPPEKTLDMIAKVWEMAGLMVDEKR